MGVVWSLRVVDDMDAIVTNSVRYSTEINVVMNRSIAFFAYVRHVVS